MAIVAVSISPVGEGVGVSIYVARALAVLQRSGLEYEMGPMFTTIEGDLDQILEVVRRMQESVFAEGARRVSTVMKIDDRRDCDHSMEGKLQSARAHLEGAVEEDRGIAQGGIHDGPGAGTAR